MGFPSLVLTTVGAKSGAPRHTPVAYFPDGPDSWLIVASAAGAAEKPDWYYNLRAHPDDVQIQLAGRSYAVCAEQLKGAARRRVARDHQHRKTFRGLRAENRPRTAGHPAAHPP